MRFFSKILVPIIVCASIVIAAFYGQSCNMPAGDITVDITKDAAAKLTDYNLFKGKLADLIPNGRLLPYTLITPLFSDYAEKSRFVWIPQGKQATYTTDGVIDLPVGAVIVKTFYYPNDFRDAAKGRRIMETRLLIHRESGWDAETYVWNDEQTEAVREIAGVQKPVSFINANGEKVSFTYGVPNKNQCSGCHELGGKITPIGPKVRNMNCNYTYAEGEMNQLKKWESIGFLTGLQANAPKVAKWNDAASGTLDDRARAYLDINCAHCHNPKGPAKNSGLDLSYTNNDPTAIGIGKYPVAAGGGAGKNKFDIDPGHPENSILNYRLESTNSEVMMPELGRTLVHTEGVALIREWVLAMKPQVP